MWLQSGSHVAYIRVTPSWKTQMPDAKDDQNIPICEGANLRNGPTSYYHLLYHRIEAQILNTHSPRITTPCIPRTNAIDSYASALADTVGPRSRQASDLLQAQNCLARRRACSPSAPTACRIPDTYSANGASSREPSPQSEMGPMGGSPKFFCISFPSRHHVDATLGEGTSPARNATWTCRPCRSPEQAPKNASWGGARPQRPACACACSYQRQTHRLAQLHIRSYGLVTLSSSCWSCLTISYSIVARTSL
jgi:hypothetical protein